MAIIGAALTLAAALAWQVRRSRRARSRHARAAMERWEGEGGALG